MDAMTPEILPQFLRMVIALGFVLVLMGGLAFMLKKFGLSANNSVKSGDKRRLKIVESLPLDPRRRLAIIKCDEKEHLVILSANGESIIDKDIVPVDDCKNNDKSS